MTLFEKIKGMTLEEMSVTISKNISCISCPIPPHLCCNIYRSPRCAGIVKEWLESEVDKNDKP